MTIDARAQALLDLAAKLQREKHEAAVVAHPLFSKAHWEHNAGRDWPEQPDDDSYLAFENCADPDCVLVRSAEWNGKVCLTCGAKGPHGR